MYWIGQISFHKIRLSFALNTSSWLLFYGIFFLLLIGYQSFFYLIHTERTKGLYIIASLSKPFTNHVVVRLPKSSLILRPPSTAAHLASLPFISWSLLKVMSIKSVTPSSHLTCCCPSFSCPPSFPASGSFPVSWLFASGGQNIGA